MSVNVHIWKKKTAAKAILLMIHWSVNGYWLMYSPSINDVINLNQVMWSTLWLNVFPPVLQKWSISGCSGCSEGSGFVKYSVGGDSTQVGTESQWTDAAVGPRGLGLCSPHLEHIKVMFPPPAGVNRELVNSTWSITVLMVPLFKLGLKDTTPSLTSLLRDDLAMTVNTHLQCALYLNAN